MSQMYKAVSPTNGQEVRMYACNIKSGYKYAVYVNNREYAYTDSIADAYRLYNDLAR